MERYKSSNLKKYQDLFVRIPLAIFLKILNRLINSLHVTKILDMGCGEGFVVRYLINNNKDLSIDGIDISEQAIATARQLCPDASFNIGDISKIDYPDKSFDLILAIEVLEHLVKPAQAIKEAMRLTRRYCIFSVPWEPYFSICNLLRGKNIPRWGRPQEHLWYWTGAQFNEFLRHYFKKIKTMVVFPWIIALCED